MSLKKSDIKSGIETLNKGNYTKFCKKHDVTEVYVKRFIKTRFLDSMTERERSEIKRRFYSNGAKVNGNGGCRDIANQHYILTEHVQQMVSITSDDDWKFFLDICIDKINSYEYGGRAQRIPTREEVLDKLQEKFQLLTAEEKRELWLTFASEGYKVGALKNIANANGLYIDDLYEFFYETPTEQWSLFLDNNISVINADSTLKHFEDTLPNNKQIEEYLGAKIRSYNILSLLDDVEKGTLKEEQLIEVANTEKLFVEHLRRALRYQTYYQKLSGINEANIKEDIRPSVEKYFNADQLAFLGDDISLFLDKIAALIRVQGFGVNKMNLNSGKMTANSGDAAQFLFLARAILLGYNCSNVDVRSSRYDAVIDYEGTILKIQVKGLSDSRIYFKDRDRGGVGTDATNIGNKGKYINSKECDIYVAVDKLCGICYILPVAEYIDSLSRREKAKGVDVVELLQYKENWDVIEQIAKEKNS